MTSTTKSESRICSFIVEKSNNKTVVDRSKGVLLLWIVFVSYALCWGVSVLCSLVVTCWERAGLLAVVCVVFCHFPNVSWYTSESRVRLAP